MVRALLSEKYGKEFTLQAMENSDGKVAKRVVDRLKVEPPARELVDAYLSTIAEAYGVDWPPGTKARREAEEEGEADEDDDDDDNPSGGQKVKATEAPLTTQELTKATPPRDLGPKSPVSVAPPSPSTDNVRPKVNLPGPPDLKPGKKMVDASKKKEAEKKGESGPGGKIPDVNELAARFAQLKR